MTNGNNLLIVMIVYAPDLMNGGKKSGLFLSSPKPNTSIILSTNQNQTCTYYYIQVFFTSYIMRTDSSAREGRHAP